LNRRGKGRSLETEISEEKRKVGVGFVQSKKRYSTKIGGDARLSGGTEREK